MEIISGINFYPFVLSDVEGLREVFSDLLVAARANLRSKAIRGLCWFFTHNILTRHLWTNR